MIAVEMVRGPEDGRLTVFSDDHQTVFTFARLQPSKFVDDPQAEIESRLKTISYIREKDPVGMSQGVPRYRALYVPDPS